MNFSSSLFRDKLRASALHLCISALIAGLSLCLVYLVWYPDPFAMALGVGSVFLVLVAVDVVLGPLLTFLVFKKGKRTLKFDLAVIALLQAAAFLYGMYVVAQGRPVWVVFAADRFDLVTSLDIDAASEEKANSEYRHQSWVGPRWVAATNPTDIEKRNTIIFESVNGGPDLPQRPNLYLSLNQVSIDMQQRIRPLAELNVANSPETVAAVLAAHREADGWLPLMARAQPMVVLMRTQDAKVISVVPLNPWR